MNPKLSVSGERQHKKILFFQPAFISTPVHVTEFASPEDLPLDLQTELPGWDSKLTLNEDCVERV